MSKTMYPKPIWLNTTCSKGKFLLADRFAIIPDNIERLPSKCSVILKYVYVESNFYKRMVNSSGKVKSLFKKQSSFGGKSVAC